MTAAETSNVTDEVTAPRPTVLPTVAPDNLPAVYDTIVHHARLSPLRHTFTYRSRSWLVDLDALPGKGFQARDHIGQPDRTLRENVEALLAEKDLRCARVLLLTSPRRLGHVFNPLSVFWCLDARGVLVATIAEVHNTYGGRHAYVLPAGTETVDKTFYVSPFHPVEGHYHLRLPLPSDELRLGIAYQRKDALPFIATVRGTRSRTARTRPRDLCATRLVAARIRIQGIRLYRRGLSVVPRRPAPEHQERS